MIKLRIAFTLAAVLGSTLSACKSSQSSPAPAAKTLGLVVLVEGNELFFGDEKYRTAETCSDPSKQPCRVLKTSAGIFDGVVAGLGTPGGAAPLANAGPAGSRAAVIVYDHEAKVRFEGELAGLDGADLGDQSLQQGKVSRDLGVGLDGAADAFDRLATDRKILLVVSDGLDRSPAKLAAARERLRAAGVEVTSFRSTVAAELIPDEPDVVAASRANLASLGKVVDVDSNDALAKAMVAAVTPSR